MSNEQRERIVQGAVATLTAGGLAAVSVRGVATAAGVSMGTLRHYFPSQRELHAAVVVRVLDDVIPAVDMSDATVPAAERLTRGLAQFLPANEAMRPQLEAWAGLYRAALDPDTSELAREFLRLAGQRTEAHLTHWLTILADEGCIAPAAITELVILLSAVIAGLCMELSLPGAALTVERAHQVLARATRVALADTASESGAV